MPECQGYGCTNKAGEGVAKGKRFFQIPNAAKDAGKRELAMRWLHNIGTGHTVNKFNFNRKVVCEDHFTTDDFKEDIQNRVLGLPERKLLKNDAVPTVFVHRQRVTPPVHSGAKCCCSVT